MTDGPSCFRDVRMSEVQHAVTCGATYDLTAGVPGLRLVLPDGVEVYFHAAPESYQALVDEMQGILSQFCQRTAADV